MQSAAKLAATESGARHWLAIDVVCLAAYTLFVVDAVAVGINVSSLSVAAKVQSLRFYPFLFLVPGTVIGLLAARLRLGGVPHLFVGLSVVYFLCRQFRGAWIWDGTFDKFAEPMTSWLSPLLIGGVAGFLVGLAASHLPSSYAHSTRRTILHALALAVTGVGSWALTALYPNDSFFPATRAVGNFSLVALVLVASYWLNMDTAS